jgi:multicomponent K+:H+ antiporter subunit D
MNAWLVAPIALPIAAAATLILMRQARPEVRHAFALAATLSFSLISAWLALQATSGETYALLLGNWRAPFGIVLVLDRLSGWMLLLTAVVGFAALVAAIRGDYARRLHFHVLFQVQLAGIAGAFLTGDLFNLFVCFEVLLAASYGLLLYSGERQTRRASLHYIVFNLVGSLLFLVAAGLIYGVAGTLNFSELATIGGQLPASDEPLMRAAMLLLLLVFSIKAAALPLGLWLPATYGAADPPVAALFALLTKVGVYAVIRIFVGVFGATDPQTPWVYLSTAIPAIGALTLLFGAFGALAASHLRGIAASLVMASAGTLLIAAGTPGGVAAALYYAAHSTLAGAMLFLVSGAIGHGRPDAADRLVPAPAMARHAVIGGLFLFVAIAVSGLPPLSGFIGKVILLADLVVTPGRAHLVAAVLLGSLTTLIALSRAGTILFWQTEPQSAGRVCPPQGTPADLYGAGLLLAGLLTLVLAGGPIQRYLDATARQQADVAATAAQLLNAQPLSQPGRQP